MHKTKEQFKLTVTIFIFIRNNYAKDDKDTKFAERFHVLNNNEHLKVKRKKITNFLW